MELRWKLKELLTENGKTAYALSKRSGVGLRAVYSITLGRKRRVELDTLSALITALEEMLGREVAISDILEIQRR